MAISLNKVNSEVVRAHTRIDGIKIPGINSKWHNVTGSRKANTVYTNSYNEPIQVSISWNTGTNGPNYGVILVDGLRVASEVNQGWSGWRAGVWATVPAGSTYQFNGSGVELWLELYTAKFILYKFRQLLTSINFNINIIIKRGEIL